MPLPIDTSRAIRSRADQQELVAGVLAAQPAEQETNWLEWKGALDLASRQGRATIAKAVLGFANRSPAAAERSAEGCGYLLVGVQPGEATGVEPVDLAKLEAGVATYTGREVDWRADYLFLDEGAVLVVTVEPPRQGDPIHPARKSFQPSKSTGGPSFQSGTVFVRRQASTDHADAEDIDMLSRRAVPAGGMRLAVSLQLAEHRPLRRIDAREETIAGYVTKARSGLLAPFSDFNRLLRQSSLTALRMAQSETRSEERFRADVAEYLAELSRRLPEVLRARAVLRDIGRLGLELVNDTDSTFSGVQVEIAIPVGVGVCVWREGAEEQSKLPDAPPRYGTQSIPRWPHTDFGVRAIGPTRPLFLPEVSERGEGNIVTFRVGDVRPHGRSSLQEVWLVLDQEAPDEVTLGWEATATNASGRIRGTLRLPVELGLVDPAALLADVDRDEDRVAPSTE